MTTTFFLLRHAAHDNVGGYLAGRIPGVHLGQAGQAQAGRLAKRMARERLAAIHASPRERTRETAETVAATCGLADVHIEPELDEVDFGAWSGQDFETLNRDPAWRRWNETRSLARAPGGETMLDVQTRAMRVVERLLRAYVDAAVALVSHGDVIKSIVIHVLGLSVDAWSRFDIAPASISTIAIGDWGGKVLNLNEGTP